MVKVAICDDEKNIRAYLSALVRKQGMECEITEYAAAEDYFAGGAETDILFLDIELECPGQDMDGMEMARQIRGMEDTKQPIIIFVTDAFYAALTDKYAKLVAEAKTHSNPEEYIYGKYYDKGSQYYETNLTDTERQIAYNYEMQMYKDGKLIGVNYQDSLFRGIAIYADVKDNDRLMFQRQTINRQISNILSGTGIDTAGIPDTCTFTVDPYSYYISVDGVDDSLKVTMEQALNQGSNGKNLYKHILTCSTQDGCNSSQVSADSKLKFQAFQQVHEYTGLKLNELEERDGTYYTKDGEDIKNLVGAAVDKSGAVPADYKAQLKQWICGMISDISGKGWNNVADMKLSILFQSGGLIDTKQSIIYSEDSEWIKDSIGSIWYSVANK